MERDLIRQSFRPKQIKVIFIGESPPANGHFFYDGNSSMFRYMAKVFGNVFGPDLTEDKFLQQFMTAHCFLDDLSYEPINNLTREERQIIANNSIEVLAERLKQYQPEYVVSVLMSIDEPVRKAVTLAGLQVPVFAVPFPGQGQQTRFVDELTRILTPILGKSPSSAIELENSQPAFSRHVSSTYKSLVTVDEIYTGAINKLELECQPLFSELAALQTKIRERLTAFADGKNLKGNELVGWLGEIYGKTLFDGTLVDDREEHDFITSDGARVSVKTRKGTKNGWKTTSAIPKIEGPDCPTHLLFVHLNDDYSLDRIWRLDWQELIDAGRFRKHVVRGSHRSYIFSIDEEIDKASVVYCKNS